MSSPPVTNHRFRENGARIRRARELVRSTRPAANHKPDRPISQHDFAAIVGVSMRHLIRLENGQHLPGSQLRDRIVEVTGTIEQIEAADDDEEEAALMRALMKRLGMYSPATDLPWRAIYIDPNPATVARLRRSALIDLARAREIEETLS